MKRRRTKKQNKGKAMKQWRSSRYSKNMQKTKKWTRYFKFRFYLDKMTAFYRGSLGEETKLVQRQVMNWRNMNRPYHLQGMMTTVEMIKKQSVPYQTDLDRVDIKATLPASVLEMTRRGSLAAGTWRKRYNNSGILDKLLSNEGVTNQRDNEETVEDNEGGEENWVEELRKAGYTEKAPVTWLAGDVMGESGPAFEAITFDISRKSLRPNVAAYYQDDDDMSYDDSMSDEDMSIMSSNASFASNQQSIGAVLRSTVNDDQDTVFEVLSFDLVQDKSGASIQQGDDIGDLLSVDSQSTGEGSKSSSTTGSGSSASDSLSSHSSSSASSGSNSVDSGSISGNSSMSDSDGGSNPDGSSGSDDSGSSEASAGTSRTTISRNSLVLPDGTTLEYETVQADVSVVADDDNLSILSSELQDQFELLNLREDGIDFNRNRRND
jgi:hypothetical protein